MARKDLARLAKERVSIMPDGLGETMQPQDLADRGEFLAISPP